MAYRQSARFKAQRLTVNLRTSFSWPRTKQSDLESCEFCHRYALLTAQGASDPYLYVGCSRAEIPHFQRLLDMWPAVRMGPLLALGLAFIARKHPTSSPNPKITLEHCPNLAPLHSGRAVAHAWVGSRTAEDGGTSESTPELRQENGLI